MVHHCRVKRCFTTDYTLYHHPRCNNSPEFQVKLYIRGKNGFQCLNLIQLGRITEAQSSCTLIKEKKVYMLKRKHFQSRNAVVLKLWPCSQIH